jgi:helix-turn-helix protein
VADFFPTASMSPKRSPDLKVMPTARTARRMFELLEPICLVTYFADECNQELAALGHRTYWDGYFASRAAPLGRVPAQVVHAAFYSFADGEAARHIPSAWETIPPEASVAARLRGSAASLRRILGAELADSPGLVRAADLTTRAATSAPTEGRVMYAGMRTLPVPGEPLARLWHSATMLREHRGDGHVAALVGARIGGTEAHVLSALEMGIHPPESFGRIHHLPEERLTAVMDGLRRRGLVDADGRFTDAGRETKHRIEALTDELAAPPYDALAPAELDELVAELEPITARLVAAGSR